MSVKFKTLERGEPGVVGGGTKKWYAIKANTGRVNLEQMSSDITEFCSLSEPDVLAVIRALLKLMPRYIKDGKIIEMGSLGNLRLNFSSTGHATEEEVSGSSIYRPRLSFYANSKLQETLNNLKFSKID